MRFLADECCAASLVQALRQDGHDIVYVGEEFAGLSATRCSIMRSENVASF